MNEKLIGWRTADYTAETSDPDMAKNWAANVTVLPIFEGDPNTKLGVPLASQPAEQPRGELDKAIHAIDDLVALNGEDHDEAAWKLIRVRILASQPKAATGDEKFRNFEISHEPRTSTADQAVATAGDGVTDDAAARVLRKITERVEHYGRVGRTGDKYTDGRRHEAQLILDLCTAALPSPSAPRVGVPEGYTLVWDSELTALRERESVFNDADRGGHLWYWQGDGQDVPESLTCAVVMSADTLRALLAAAPEGPHD